MSDKSKLIDIDGLGTFLEGVRKEMSETTGVTYTFEQSGTTLIIDGSDGTHKEIELGGEITKQAIIDALGFTPMESYTETDPIFVASVAYGIKSEDIANWNSKASTDVVTTSTNGLMSSTDKTKLDSIRKSVISTTEPTLSVNEEWLLEY